MNIFTLVLESIKEKYGLKKLPKVVDTLPSGDAQNRTNKFYVLDKSNGNIHTLFPGELRGFIKSLDGNYDSVMSQRSTYPNKDINIWVYRFQGGQHYYSPDYVLMAKTYSMHSI